MANKSKNHGVKLEGVCEMCGKHFTYLYNGGPARRFCSKKCSQKKWDSENRGSVDLIKRQSDVVKRLHDEIFSSLGDDSSILDDIDKSTTGMSKTEFCATKIRLMKENAASRNLKVCHHPKYAEFLSERKKLVSMQVTERKRKERMSTRERQRNSLKHKLQKARRDGLRIGYKRCPECGSIFGYIMEQKTKTGSIPIPKQNTPTYCSDSCVNRHAWLTRKKKQYEEKKAQNERNLNCLSEENNVNLKITWRGSGNFYTMRHSYNSSATISSPFRKIDSLLSVDDD